MKQQRLHTWGLLSIAADGARAALDGYFRNEHQEHQRKRFAKKVGLQGWPDIETLPLDLRKELAEVFRRHGWSPLDRILSPEGPLMAAGIPGFRVPQGRPPVPPSPEQVDVIARKIGEEKRKIQEAGARKIQEEESPLVVREMSAQEEIDDLHDRIASLEELALQGAKQIPAPMRKELAEVCARNGLRGLADLIASTLEPSPDDPEA